MGLSVYALLAMYGHGGLWAWSYMSLDRHGDAKEYKKMILIPWLLGKGSLLILYGKRAKREFSAGDSFLTGWMISIGLAEAAHIIAVLFGQSFSDCIKLFTLCVLVCSGLAILLLAVNRLLNKEERNYSHYREKLSGLWAGQSKGMRAAGILFILMLAVQFVTIIGQPGVYRGGDMTLETVQSFLSTDAIYQVNPLTGRAYELGMPSRLKLLCLPTLYGSLSRIFRLKPETVIWTLIPLFVLAACYLAYGTVARILFSEDRFARRCFMVLVALLVWVSDYMYGMEGFGLLHCGFRGVSVRGAVLLPYIAGLVLRKKWKVAVLCILTEACIVWTLYGLGICFFVAVGMSVTAFGLKLWRKRRQAGAKEEQVWRS